MHADAVQRRCSRADRAPSAKAPRPTQGSLRQPSLRAEIRSGRLLRKNLPEKKGLLANSKLDETGIIARIGRSRRLCIYSKPEFPLASVGETESTDSGGMMSKLPLSKGQLVALTLAVYIIFLILVSYGWWTWIVRTDSPPLSLIIQGLLVALIVLVASITIRAIAILKAQSDAPEGSRPTLRWIGYWAVVALITVLGTISGAFHWIESKAILRDDIAAVQNKFDTLSQSAVTVLGSNAYRQEKDSLTDHLNELRGEIDESTGQQCGFGRNAQIALDKINSIVVVQRVSGSVPIKPCDKERARRMYEPYPARAWAAFDAKWQGAKSSERRKEDVLRKILADRQYHHAELDKLAAASDGSGNADAIDKSALIKARSAFNTDIAQLREFVPDIAETIGDIGRFESSDTETYASTFRLIFGRLDNYSTWIYAGIAIILDLLLIGLLSHLAMRYARIRGASTKLSDEERRLVLKFEQDPRFLWTNYLTSIGR